MISPSAIDHTCLIVTSLTKTRQHFEMLFNFSFQPRQGDPNTWVVESTDVHFFISQVTDAPADFLRLQHISFRVATLEAVIAKLHSAGIGDYATGHVDFFAHNNYRWCEWRDPDGIRVECVELI
ncbi:hypothetical protein MNBD_CHLOROFLEXI01-3164 [hydrothermal vent metagenome]|uniref:VOC domain-containing protein n=1 Tax=hydrothermal vent metagenome TaxID=652676 RepID=A0A3B0UWK7_9ZZZZ